MFFSNWQHTLKCQVLKGIGWEPPRGFVLVPAGNEVG